MDRSTLAIALFLLVLLLVLPGAAVTADGILYADSVYPGVEIFGLEAGGLAESDLDRILDGVEQTVSRRTLSVTHEGEVVLEASAEDMGVFLDRQASAAALLAPGHDDDLIARLRERAGLRLSGRSVSPVLEVNPDRFVAVADEIAIGVEELPLDASLILAEGQPKATASEEGLALDREALEAAVLEAVAADLESIDAPVSTVPPGVTTESAVQAVQAAKNVFSGPITLGYRDRRFTLETDRLLEMAAVNGGGTGARPVTFDTEQGRAVLESMLGELAQPAKDASIRFGPDGGFEVLAGENGVEVDWEPLFKELDRVALATGSRYVPIPTRAAKPRLTTLDATRLGIRTGAASFTTYFSPANEARANNIRQVAEILDGTLIEPGETFSFNETVGPRTKAAGFDEAPVIVGGVLTPGVGGGICQVSTTLFNAVFLAGLPVVERKPHSFFIAHYPVGRDATVSYGTVDFKFTNDSDRLLYLSVQATDRSVTVALGADGWDRRVEYEAEGPTDEVLPATSEESPRRLRDPALEPGEVAPVESGVAGRTVAVRRTVYGSDGGVLLRDSFQSVYQPKDYIQRVGG